MKKLTYLFVLLAAVVLGSCDTFKNISIEKRHYRKGYYVHVRDERSSEKTIAEQEVPATENAWTENKPVVENTGAAVENNSQATTARAKENAGPKKFFAHFPKPFKKGSAVFHERARSVVPAPKITKTTADDDDRAVALVLLVILAIILPPLAVLLADGVGTKFLIDLIFWLLGFGFVIFISGVGFVFLGIFGLIAIIYALLVVFDAI